MTADALTVVTLALSLATAIAGVIAWLAARGERERAQQIEAYRAVHSLYDEMISLRFDHPEFLVCAREWTADCMTAAYAQDDDAGRLWAQYSAYVEVCIGFTNAVLQAHASGSMGEPEYSHQWKRLVAVVVAEHYPILQALAENGPYLSEYLQAFIREEQARPDWDWQERHLALTWTRRDAARRTDDGLATARR